MFGNFNCCKYCGDRAVGCHGTCTDYIKAVEKHNKEKENKRKEDEIHRSFSSMRINSTNKAKRRKPSSNA